MVKSNPHKPSNGRTNLASCIVATIFLIFLLILILLIYFTVFKPKKPNITVTAVQLPSFSASNGTVNFTFSQYATINNNNRAVFTHYDSSLQLLYAGTQVGFMFIPAGKIDAGKTEYMSATFSVHSFPLSFNKPESAVVGPTVTEGFNGFRLGPSMEIESRLEMSGRVQFLHFFTHHVDARAECRVVIDVNDGYVLGFHC
ncbi:Late embryogenesis abundant (LEA) hydroxyproline-rich glycoprotein family [Forsythia ovata]|uniref:Late embryogenesis abundant (LEA) hydroxyproline-rich glycoprotein family n=1 Tax=Forsythia ovata TaxID=205694 RepID=A0ABD1WN67_9LAMI